MEHSGWAKTIRCRVSWLYKCAGTGFVIDYADANPGVLVIDIMFCVNIFCDAYAVSMLSTSWWPTASHPIHLVYVLACTLSYRTWEGSIKVGGWPESAFVRKAAKFTCTVSLSQLSTEVPWLRWVFKRRSVWGRGRSWQSVTEQLWAFKSK